MGTELAGSAPFSVNSVPLCFNPSRNSLAERGAQPRFCTETVKKSAAKLAEGGLAVD